MGSEGDVRYRVRRALRELVRMARAGASEEDVRGQFKVIHDVYAKGTIRSPLLQREYESEAWALKLLEAWLLDGVEPTGEEQVKVRGVVGKWAGEHSVWH